MPSIHQSVFVKPEHGFFALARWRDSPDNRGRLHLQSGSPYVEVHLGIDDLNICFFVDKAEAPKLALALDRLSHALLRPMFAACEE